MTLYDQAAKIRFSFLTFYSHVSLVDSFLFIIFDQPRRTPTPFSFKSRPIVVCLFWEVTLHRICSKASMASIFFPNEEKIMFVEKKIKSQTCACVKGAKLKLKNAPWQKPCCSSTLVRTQTDKKNNNNHGTTMQQLQLEAD